MDIFGNNIALTIITYIIIVALHAYIVSRWMIRNIKKQEKDARDKVLDKTQTQ